VCNGLRPRVCATVLLLRRPPRRVAGPRDLWGTRIIIEHDKMSAKLSDGRTLAQGDGNSHVHGKTRPSVTRNAPGYGLPSLVTSRMTRLRSAGFTIGARCRH
jgi:hypothetical protein